MTIRIENEISENLASQIVNLSEHNQDLLAGLLEKLETNTQLELNEHGMLHQFMKATIEGAAQEDYEALQAEKARPVTKDFPQSEMYFLPKPRKDLKNPIDDLIEARFSSHNFSNTKISLEELSTLLHYAYGVKSYRFAYNHKSFAVRNSPSAGGLQPVDLYAVVNLVEGLPKGLYYYNAIEHGMQLVDEGNMRHRLVGSSVFQEWLTYAPVTFILVANMERVLWKYGTRAYRYVHADTGVLTQMLYLVGTALDFNTCAIAAYFDDMVNDLIGIDGQDEFTTLLFAIGHKPHLQKMNSAC